VVANVKQVNAFFIRRKNWFAFHEETEEMEAIMEQQRKASLEDYVRKVYMPIQRF